MRKQSMAAKSCAPLLDASRLEAALLRHPSVADCVVLPRPIEADGQQLVAYVVPVGPFAPDLLEAYLQELVPAGAKPSAYVPAAVLPLTPSGQVDEQALGRIEVLDAELVNHWEQRLRTLSGV